MYKENVNDDDFPYKRLNYSDEDIYEMFEKLKRFNVKERILILEKPYTLRNVSDEIPLLFEGNPVILLNKPSDYEDWNLLSDMFQERCRMKCKLFTQKDSPHEFYMKNKRFIERKTIEKYGSKTPFNIREYLYKTYKECTSHRPSNIVALIQLFGAKTVFDFSSGWGDRLIGAMATDVEYCGVDPNSCLHPNYKEMIGFFAKNPNKYTMIEGRIEDVIIPLPTSRKRGGRKAGGGYDLVYTSPPYYDLEIYEKHDKNLYSNEDIWFNNFFSVALQKSWDVLSPFGGIMAININQKHRGEKYISKMIDFVSKSLEGSEYLGVISYSEEHLRNPQPIWIWRKSIANDHQRQQPNVCPPGKIYSTKSKRCIQDTSANRKRLGLSPKKIQKQ